MRHVERRSATRGPSRPNPMACDVSVARRAHVLSIPTPAAALDESCKDPPARGVFPSEGDDDDEQYDDEELRLQGLPQRELLVCGQHAAEARRVLLRAHVHVWSPVRLPAQLQLPGDEEPLRSMSWVRSATLTSG